MLSIGIIYLVIVAIICLVLWRKNPGKVAQSLKIARNSLVRMLPMLLAIFGLIGLFQEFVPPELVFQYLSADNGYLALLFGSVAGAISIGPPLAAYPLAETLLKSGAWPPAIAAFILSWISVGIVTLPLEGSVFGYRFAFLRNFISFLAAMLSGLLVGALL
jgi:uncharacterized membrane protein YraQ (UPF0718 family)